MITKEKRQVLLIWLLTGVIIVTAGINLSLTLIGSDAGLHPLQVIEMIAWSLVPVAFVAVGCLIIVKRSRNLIGWLLMLPGALLLVDTLLAHFLRGISNPPSTPSFMLYVAVWFSQTGWLMLFRSLVLQQQA